MGSIFLILIRNPIMKFSLNNFRLNDLLTPLEPSPGLNPNSTVFKTPEKTNTFSWPFGGTTVQNTAQHFEPQLTLEDKMNLFRLKEFDYQNKQRILNPKYLY